MRPKSNVTSLDRARVLRVIRLRTSVRELIRDAEAAVARCAAADYTADEYRADEEELADLRATLAELRENNEEMIAILRAATP